MKILFLTIGDENVASSRVRIYGYLPFLKKKGVLYKLISFTSGGKQERVRDLKQDSPWQRITEILYKIYVITKIAVLSKSYDMIVVQKVVLPKAAWGLLRALNGKIVFDFDDAIYLSRDIVYLLKGASAVLVSNKALREFASAHNKKVYELPSPVDVTGATRPKDGSCVTLSWTGSPGAARYLYPLMPVFRKLKERFRNLNIEFTGTGPNKDFQSLGIAINEWSPEEEKWHLERADIGIMPLADDEWSRSKAGYKALLYMSKAIPCVASPVGINTAIITDAKNGYLATSEDEWLVKLSSLIENKDLRERLGKEAKVKVKNEYSYNVTFPKFYTALASVR